MSTKELRNALFDKIEQIQRKLFDENPSLAVAAARSALSELKSFLIDALPDSQEDEIILQNFRGRQFRLIIEDTRYIVGIGELPTDSIFLDGKVTDMQVGGHTLSTNMQRVVKFIEPMKSRRNFADLWREVAYFEIQPEDMRDDERPN